MSESATPRPTRHDDALLKHRLDDICAGLCKAIDREVEQLRYEGLPIYVSDNGKVVDQSLDEREAGTA